VHCYPTTTSFALIHGSRYQTWPRSSVTLGMFRPLSVVLIFYSKLVDIILTSCGLLERSITILSKGLPAQRPSSKFQLKDLTLRKVLFQDLIVIFVSCPSRCLLRLLLQAEMFKILQLLVSLSIPTCSCSTVFLAFYHEPTSVWPPKFPLLRAFRILIFVTGLVQCQYFHVVPHVCSLFHVCNNHP
jgi:hypothetical protein